MRYEAKLSIERNDDEVTLEVQFEHTPEVPAVTWGPPDNWCPAEGGLEEVTLKLNGEEWDGTLTKQEDAQLERVIEETLEAASERDYEHEQRYCRTGM